MMLAGVGLVLATMGIVLALLSESTLTVSALLGVSVLFVVMGVVFYFDGD